MLNIKQFVLLLLALTTLSFSNSKWEIHLGSGDYQQIKAWNNQLWVATQGGVFSFSPTSPEITTQWTTQNGLGENNIVDLFVNNNALLAISENGIIHQFSPQTNRFQIIHRAYKSGHYIPQIASSSVHDNFLILTFQNQLSFFDINAKRSLINLDKIGNSQLKNEPIQGIKIISDTLYSWTSNNLYKIPFSPNDDNINYYDPSQWLEVKLEILPPFDYLSFSNQGWQIDSLKEFTSNSKKHIGSSTFGDSFIPSFSDTLSGNWYIGNKSKIFYGNTQITALPNLSNIPNKSYTMVSQAHSSQVFLSQNKAYLMEGSKFPGVEISNTGFSSSQAETFDRLLKGLLIKDSIIGISTWGNGLRLYDIKKGEAPFREQIRSSNSCVQPYNPGDGFDVFPNTSLVGNNIWFNIHHINNKYSLAYVDINFEVHCFDYVGQLGEPGTFFDLGENIFLVTHPSGVEQFELKEDDLTKLDSWTNPNLGRGFMTTQDENSKIWYLTDDHLGVICNGEIDENLCPTSEDIDIIKSTNSSLGLPNTSLRAMVTDPLGNIWLGTGDGLFYIKTTFPLSAQSVTQFTTTDGMANNSIWDLHHDASTGKLWITHSNGISIFNTGVEDTKLNDNKTNVRVFPNPLRYSKHKELVIDRLPSESQVILVNANGNRVNHWTEEETETGSIRWNLADQPKKLKAGPYQVQIITNKDKQNYPLLILP